MYLKKTDDEVQGADNPSTAYFNWSYTKKNTLNMMDNLQGNVINNTIRQVMDKVPEGYANYKQAYRPVLFNDLTGNPTTDVIDQNLKDSRSYNIALGYHGRLKDYLCFDISCFLL